MDGPGHGWEQDLDCWLKPFLDGLSRQAQRSWAPVYLNPHCPKNFSVVYPCGDDEERLQELERKQAGKWSD